MITMNYYEFYKISKDMYQIRLDMVQSALKIGIKPTARAFETTPKTVRKWVNRFKEHKKPGLKDKPKTPKTCPHQLKPYWEFKIIDECKRLESIGKRKSAQAIRREFKVPASLPTVLRVIKKHGFYKGKRTIVQKKKNLIEAKKKYKAFEKMQVDVKYLDDIPEMYREYKEHKLPRYQFTARCVRTGALFVCYAREKTVTNAAIFIMLLYYHLLKYKINLANCTIQTDNGTEFTSPWNTLKKTIFTLFIEKAARAEHRLIPPGAKTWQSDVESSHRLIEDELYAAESFSSLSSFLKQAKKYTSNFNLDRKNNYKKGTPIELARLTYPDISKEIFKFTPVILDDKLKEVKDELAQWAA